LITNIFVNDIQIFDGFVSWKYYDGTINYFNHWFSFPLSLSWKDFKIWGIIFWWSHMQYWKPKAVFFDLGLITRHPTYQCFVTELHEHACLSWNCLCLVWLTPQVLGCDNSPHPHKGARENKWNHNRVILGKLEIMFYFILYLN
jgi:hypothetical protein